MIEEERIKRELHEHPVPLSEEAEERSWALVRAAFDQEDRSPHRARLRSRLTAIAGSLIAAGAILGLVLTPAGATVTDWVQTAVGGSGTVTQERPALRPTFRRVGACSSAHRGRSEWLVAEDGVTAIPRRFPECDLVAGRPLCRGRRRQQPHRPLPGRDQPMVGPGARRGGGSGLGAGLLPGRLSQRWRPLGRRRLRQLQPPTGAERRSGGAELAAGALRPRHAAVAERARLRRRGRSAAGGRRRQRQAPRRHCAEPTARLDPLAEP